MSPVRNAALRARIRQTSKKRSRLGINIRTLVRDDEDSMMQSLPQRHRLGGPRCDHFVSDLYSTE